MMIETMDNKETDNIGSGADVGASGGGAAGGAAGVGGAGVGGSDYSLDAVQQCPNKAPKTDDSSPCQQKQVTNPWERVRCPLSI